MTVVSLRKIRILGNLEIFMLLSMAVFGLTSASCTIPNIKKFAQCAKKCYMKLHGLPTKNPTTDHSKTHKSTILSSVDSSTDSLPVAAKSVTTTEVTKVSSKTLSLVTTIKKSKTKDASFTTPIFFSTDRSSTSIKSTSAAKSKTRTPLKNLTSTSRTSLIATVFPSYNSSTNVTPSSSALGRPQNSTITAPIVTSVSDNQTLNTSKFWNTSKISTFFISTTSKPGMSTKRPSGTSSRGESKTEHTVVGVTQTSFGTSTKSQLSTTVASMPTSNTTDYFTTVFPWYNSTYFSNRSTLPNSSQNLIPSSLGQVSTYTYNISTSGIPPRASTLSKPTENQLTTKPSFLSTILSDTSSASVQNLSTVTMQTQTSTHSSPVSPSVVASSNMSTTLTETLTKPDENETNVTTSTNMETSPMDEIGGESENSVYTTQIVILNDPEAFPNQAPKAVKIYFVLFFLCTVTLLVIFIVYLYN